MYPARFQLHQSNSFDTKSRNVRHRCFSLFYCLTVLPLAVHAEQEGEDIDAIVGALAVLPFKVGADASLFVGESGRLVARLEFAYKYRITDKLSLTPDLEANFYSETDTETSTGSGLADLDLGLRLRYRIINGLSPYAGITWKGNFATTEDIVEDRGEDTGDLRLLLGVTLWF